MTPSAPVSARLLALALLALAGCSAEAVPDSHAHERPSVQVTVHAGGHELFVEYEVPVAGQPVTFATHVSEAATGAPRRSGPVTYVLRSGAGGSARVEAPGPARDGVYLPELTFASAGTWSVALEVPGPAGTATVTLGEVEVHASGHDADHAAVPPEPEGTTFLKEQQWRLGTVIEPLARRPLAARIAVAAEVRAAPERQAVVTPPVAGRFEAVAERPLRLGTVVARGELLGHVRPAFSDHLARLQEARAEVVRARLASERAAAVLARTTALFEARARSERELEEARFAADLAEQEHAAAAAVDAALRSSGVAFAADGVARFDLRAPIGGVVCDVRAVNGAWVGADAEIALVRDSAAVHVVAHVRPEELDLVVRDEQVLFVRPRGFAGSDAPAVLTALDARLVRKGDEIEPHNLTVPVVFEVGNPGGRLHIGELVEVQLQSAPASELLALPVSALVEEEGRPVAFVQVAGETFEKRYPELGIRDGEHVAVRAGIAEGERVVTRGAYAIRLAGTSGNVPAHGHTH